jgi:hypothetical protein
LHFIPFVLGFGAGRIDSGLYSRRNHLGLFSQAFALLMFLWIGFALVLPESFFTVVYEVLLIIEMLSFGIFYACFAAILYFAGRASGRDYV